MWAEVAVGLFGWTPETFWSSTPLDFSYAWEPYYRRHHGEMTEPVTRDELEQMMGRFPDR